MGTTLEDIVFAEMDYSKLDGYILKPKIKELQVCG